MVFRELSTLFSRYSQYAFSNTTSLSGKKTPPTPEKGFKCATHHKEKTLQDFCTFFLEHGRIAVKLYTVRHLNVNSELQK